MKRGAKLPGKFQRRKNARTNPLQIPSFSILVLALLATAALLTSALYFQKNSSVEGKGSSPGAGQPVTINGVTVPPPPALDVSAIVRGEQLYARYCAACHGVHLEGAANWRLPLPDGSLPAPPHDSSGHTWHHPDSVLIAITRDGGDPTQNSRMPAFKGQLTDEEIEAVLTFMKSRWGEEERRYQWWITVMSANH
jgi:mono/diheme cytochrome c family protein